MGRKNRQNKQKPFERPADYPKKNRSQKASREPWIKASQIPYGIIILAYIVVGTFTPNWMALDTNATKFMTLSFLNIVAFGYLLTRPDIRRQPGVLMRFFDTKAGIVYGVFMVVVLLSFTQAFNILESVLQFTKLFTIFSAVFILSLILMRDIRLVNLMIFAGVALLLFDSISVYYYIDKFIQREINAIFDIKSVYSNKNILASAIFVKIPFALYLWVFEKGWLKRIGLIAMSMGMLATFFMVTRGFYVGLIVITLVFIAYTLINYFKARDKKHLNLLWGYLGALLVAVVVFALIQTNKYPAVESRDAEGLVSQVASIRGDASTSVRVDAWMWSLDLVKRNPIFGVGAGNWKINILEYENQQKTDYIYLFKAHNDFIEVLTETGLAGGLAYILIFLFVFWSLLQGFLGGDQGSRRYKFLFLAGFGLLFYSFDGFFNFPIDRPEIQVLFALYLAVGLVTALGLKEEEKAGQYVVASADELESQQQKKSLRPLGGRMFSLIVIVLMFASSYVLYHNYESSKLQRLVYQDIMRGSLTTDTDKLLTAFPFIPNVSVWGESIHSLKARYLLQEERNDEVIAVLSDGVHINPFDGRREYFLASAFNNLGEKDSALVYTKKVYEVKPNYFRNIHLMSSLLEQEGRSEEAAPYLDSFLENVQGDRQAYIYSTGYFHRQNKLDRAWEIAETALLNLPEDSLIQQQHNYIRHQKFVIPYQHVYSRAATHYNNGQYDRALPHLTEFIENTPFDANVYRMRAFSYYHLGNHQACIDDINYTFEQGHVDYSLLNLRGVCLQALGDREAACRDFRAAMEAGNASGEQNYRNFCSNREDTVE